MTTLTKVLIGAAVTVVAGTVVTVAKKAQEKKVEESSEETEVKEDKSNLGIAL